MNNPLEMLTQAQNLIRDPKNWTRDVYARDYLGQGVDSDSPDAICFCSMGALARVSDDPFRDTGRTYLQHAIRQKGDLRGNVVSFNDERTHAEVMEIFDEARKLAGARLFNCCTDHATPDWSQFDALELGGCTDDDGYTNGGIARAEAEFFTIYGHLKEGGVEAITDAKTFDEATSVMAELAGICDLPTSVVC